MTKAVAAEDTKRLINTQSCDGVQSLAYSRRSNVQQKVPISDQALLEWSNLNYFILQKPPKATSSVVDTQDTKDFLSGEDPDSLEAENLSKGLPAPTYATRGNGKSYRQIINGSSGFVRPGEMVAIMGPSGSGKTSLLNALSQRTGLSRGSVVDGEITINGRTLARGDYGKVGAFVQQDDVLQATYTVRELFEFAAGIRTNKEPEELQQSVEDTIIKMGLTACADSLIGGWLRRGISGGERKRTSIGYEMITNPSLLLLDEPTSGLDSSTALRILQLLKKQAQSGMTVLATIHQPSSALFQLFDRVILLSEGYTIYNGPPSGVKTYFENYGLRMSNYSNPADKLSIIASMPKSVLTGDNTIVRLASDSDKNQKENFMLNLEEKNDWERKLNTRFSLIAAQRKVSFCRQWWLLYKRFMVYVWRNPISIVFLFVLAAMQAFLQASIFGGVGQQKFSTDRSKNIEITTNLMGLSFLVTQDQFIQMTFGQVLQIPQYNPIFQREVSNRMYSVHAYYAAVVCMSLSTGFIYPILNTLFSFYFFQFEASDPADLMTYMACCCVLGISGSFMGLAVGTVTNNDMAAILIATSFVNIFGLCSGCIANTSSDNSNFVVRNISKLSPIHYGNEILFQQVTKGRPGRQQLLDFYGYNDTMAFSFGFLIGFALFCLILGWTIKWATNRDI